MMAIVKIYENKTKVLQVYYDRNMDPTIRLMPGERHVEAISGNLDTELSKLSADVDEAKRVRKQLAVIRVSKSIEELDKFKEGEWNEEVLNGILSKRKDLLSKKS
jgi:hypothetical protein